MRYLLTLTNLILCLGCLWGQTIEPPLPISTTKAYCGPVDNKPLAQRQHEAQFFGRWQQQALHRSSSANLRTIPVVVHLLEYDPSITNDQVERTISSLNNAFSHSQNDPNGADYSGGTRGVDTRIQFCLAQRAPDGGLSTGIVRWRSDYEEMDVDLEDAKLKTPRPMGSSVLFKHLGTPKTKY